MHGPGLGGGARRRGVKRVVPGCGVPGRWFRKAERELGVGIPVGEARRRGRDEGRFSSRKSWGKVVVEVGLRLAMDRIKR